MRAYLSVLCAASFIVATSAAHAEALKSQESTERSRTLATFSGKSVIEPTEIDERMILDMKNKLDKFKLDYDEKIRDEEMKKHGYDAQRKEEEIKDWKDKINETQKKVSQLERKTNEQQSKIDSLQQDNKQLLKRLDELSQKIK